MGLNIKADSVEVSEVSNGLLPKGKYRAIVHTITDQEGLTAKSSGAKYSRVNIRFEITQGEYAGRSVFKSVIYEHETSEVAANIGLEFLKRLYVAGKCQGELTVESLEASSEVEISVIVQEGNNGYSDRNEINFVSSVKEDAKPVETGTSEGW